ncbi:MAG: hypothetical protein ACI9XP_000300 [Lentimonas sp.]|jgi:uncharacterized protein YyaL (SSP411 family)
MYVVLVIAYLGETTLSFIVRKEILEITYPPFKMKITTLLMLLISMISCGQEKKTPQKMPIKTELTTNHLVNETSPYLLQHANNPVDWYPWGEEALEKAKNENKLLIISIGYSACHWCHVMEHESFEDEEVAKYMNDNFVAIKIDREERPDIDQVYMNAVQLLTGSGGWPLNVVALPDGRPIYGGTYFPKKNWLTMLSQISDFVMKNPEKAEQQASSLSEGVRRNEFDFSNNQEEEFSLNDLNILFENWQKNIDFTEGGYNRAPKFPLPAGYQFLLQYNHLSKNKNALRAVEVTLDKMADGGIYDQIGGGFARYSTDAYWLVPHFEKMIYDNSQLVSLYSSAYQKTKNPYYKTVVYQTLEFIEREMTSKNGAFYSSLDADSDGEEGKFYVWTKDEIQSLLGEKADLIIDYYNVTQSGNWEEGKNILHKTKSNKSFAAQHKISEKELSEIIEDAQQKMLKERSKRIRPALDDKIITAWNSLMIKGYVDAYRVFDEHNFLNTAVKNAEFILKNIQKSDYRLDRNYKNGKSTINAFLDDYAFTIDAFISLYQATFEEKWLVEAQQLSNYVLTHFYDSKSGLFFYTSNLDPSLFARKIETADNVIPAANSQMAKNLFVLGTYFYNNSYLQKAKKMVSIVKEKAITGGAYYANWDILMTWLAKEPYEIAILGENCIEKRKEFDLHYLPNVFFSGSKKASKLELLEGKFVKGQTTIYVCQNKTCKMPVTEVENAMSGFFK